MYPDYQRLTGNSWSRQNSQNADQIKKKPLKNQKKTPKNQHLKKTIGFYQPWS
jgi:hypothetical protein